eukprot:8177957-Pyramimonas_sp.AAC.1
MPRSSPCKVTTLLWKRCSHKVCSSNRAPSPTADSMSSQKVDATALVISLKHARWVAPHCRNLDVIAFTTSIASSRRRCRCNERSTF